MSRRINPRSVLERAFESRLPEYVDFVMPESEAEDAEEREFLATLKKEVDQRLFPSHGLKMVIAARMATNHGYRLMFTDREKRRLYCHFTYDEAIKVFEELEPGAAGRFLIDLVCDRILAARAKQHERTQAPEVTLDDVVKEHVPAMNVSEAAPAGSTLH